MLIILQIKKPSHLTVRSQLLVSFTQENNISTKCVLVKNKKLAAFNINSSNETAAFVLKIRGKRVNRFPPEILVTSLFGIFFAFFSTGLKFVVIFEFRLATKDAI